MIDDKMHPLNLAGEYVANLVYSMYLKMELSHVKSLFVIMSE